MAKYLVQMRRGTSAQWANSSIIPLAGELVVEIDDVNHLHKLKIGDGIHPYSELAYLTAGDEIVTQVLSKTLPWVVTVTLPVEQWEEVTDVTDEKLGYYRQYVDIANATATNRLDLQPDANTLAEFQALNLVFVTENEGGTFAIYSVGALPLKTYTMQATIVDTEPQVDCDKIVGNPVGTPAAQSDWNQTDDLMADYIKNKPIILTEEDVIKLIEENGGTGIGVELDPTVPDWAKSANPPSLAELEDDSEHRTVTDEEKEVWEGKAEIGDIASAIIEHNNSVDNHSDMRQSIGNANAFIENHTHEGLVKQTELDSYALKEDMPNVVNNLVSESTTDALSAAQGTALKTLIDNLNVQGGSDELVGRVDDLEESVRELQEASISTYTVDTITVDDIVWNRTKWNDGRYEAYCTVNPSITKGSFTIKFPDKLQNPFVSYSIIKGGLSFETNCQTTDDSFTMTYDKGTIQAVNIIVLSNSFISSYIGTKWYWRQDITFDEVADYAGGLDEYGDLTTRHVKGIEFTVPITIDGSPAGTIFTDIYISGVSSRIDIDTTGGGLGRATPGHGVVFCDTYRDEEPFDYITLTAEPSAEALDFLHTFCNQVY